jgi:hypothetical protein
MPVGTFKFSLPFIAIRAALFARGANLKPAAEPA